MNHLPLIIKREYLTKVRNKSFILMTFLSPLIMIGLFMLIFYLTQVNNNKERTISILDETGVVSKMFVEDAKEDSSITYNILKGISLKEAKEQVQATEEYGLLHIPNVTPTAKIAEQIKFYSEDSPSVKFISRLERQLSKKLTDVTLINANVDIEIVKNSKMNVSIVQESFTGERTSKLVNYSKLGFGLAAGYLLFMFIIIYGNMIMRSVIEEKTNRIIEVIISSVKPIQLLMGKIIGTSLAGITQFVMWVILGGIMAIVFSLIFGVDLMGMQAETLQQQQEALAQTGNLDMQMQISEVLNSLPLANLVVAFFVFFIGGYLLYSSLYAAIGAAVDNETDTQQFMMPIMVPLILAVYVGGFTVLEDPHGTVATVFSYIPFTSPVVMLMRIPFGVPIWQQIISVVILYISFTGTVWFASKIYRVGILMYGKKPSYKEIFKWLKY